MPKLDEKIYEHIKATPSTHYLGCLLSEIEGKFARGSTLCVDVWASLSRLVQAKRIKKSGSHRYKAYRVVEPSTRDRESPDA